KPHTSRLLGVHEIDSCSDVSLAIGVVVVTRLRCLRVATTTTATRKRARRRVAYASLVVGLVVASNVDVRAPDRPPRTRLRCVGTPSVGGAAVAPGVVARARRVRVSCSAVVDGSSRGRSRVKLDRGETSE